MEPAASLKLQSPFSLPVDSDNKATEFRPLQISSPHMRAFHLAWLSLFCCFFSTFSIPPLLPVIRDDLKLTETDIGNAGIASFVGSIFSRLAMGPACDLMGPRIASAVLSLATAPIIMSASLVTSPTSFILIRFGVGFSLANFVANQFWMTSMFSPSVVGLANGVSAGWANMGAGAAQLVMPQIYYLLISLLGLPLSTAWRVSFLIPGFFQAVTAIMVLAYGQDLPSGSYKDFRKAIGIPKDSFSEMLYNGLTNYRGWILALTYGYCFGSELTTDNIIAQYFYDRFGVNLQVAGMIAASVGLANLFSRPMGGALSDKMGRRFGMRGRLWGLWSVQTVAGLLCVLLGRVNSLWGSIAVLCMFSVFVQAASGLTFGVVPFVSKRLAQLDVAASMALSWAWGVIEWYSPPDLVSARLNCIVRDFDCGARDILSLGVIAGMTGSGGTIGAVVTQMLLFSGSRFSLQTSISLMGLMMIICTLPVTFIFFPQWGGMFFSPSCNANSSGPEDYHLLESGSDKKESK